MTAKRKKKNGAPGRRRSHPDDWYEALIGTPGKKVAAAAGALAALAYMFGYAKPIVDSGPMPVPSRQEVTDLSKSVDDRFKSTKEGLDTTLETAKAANVAAQSANQKLDQTRLERLIQQKIQLEGLLKMNDDPVLKQALAKTEIDIGILTSTIQSAAVPALAPKEK